LVLAQEKETKEKEPGHYNQSKFKTNYTRVFDPQILTGQQSGAPGQLLTNSRRLCDGNSLRMIRMPNFSQGRQLPIPKFP